jgi:hypothetical protein
MTFIVGPGALLHQVQLQARADTWRDAELVVQMRWDVFLMADRASRRRAFAAYVAALDVEAAAADELAHTHSDFTEAA